MTDPTTTAPPHGEMTTTVSLLDSARRAGHAAWLERRLYEVVGGWAADGAEPAATVAFSVQAQHHAARGAEWFTRLPELRELPASDLVVPTGEAVVATVDGLAALDATDHRAAGLATVLSALAEAYRAAAAGLSPIADGPTLRTLARALADLQEEVAALAHLAGPASAEPGLAPVRAALGDAVPLLGTVVPLVES